MLTKVKEFELAIPTPEDILHYEDPNYPLHQKVGSYDLGRGGRLEPDKQIPIEWLVIHNTEGWDDGLHYLLTNGATSVHCIGDRYGKRHNCVLYGNTAWHAGWCKPGVGNINSLGYEVINASTKWRFQSYIPEQVLMVAYTFAGWCFSYGLDTDHIVRHGDIAIWKPGTEPKPFYPRRRDPSNFNFPLFISNVKIYLKDMNSLDPQLYSRYIL